MRYLRYLTLLCFAMWTGLACALEMWGPAIFFALFVAFIHFASMDKPNDDLDEEEDDLF